MVNIRSIITEYLNRTIQFTVIDTTLDKIEYDVYDHVGQNIEKVINEEIYQQVYWRTIEKVVGYYND